jgi:3-oxoacyl-[acyl-carrier protein] reductase
MNEWAVITGGSQGIGAATCELVRAMGSRIVLMDRDTPQHDAYDEFLRVDLFEPEASARALKEILGDKVVTRYVHDAGFCFPASLHAAKLDEIQKELAVSTLSLIALAQVIVPVMETAGRGRIVALGSRAALGKQERTGYAAAKSALSGIVRTWALELGQKGINVNVVAPGPTNTRMIRENNEPDGYFLRNLAGSVPLGYIAEPMDIANVIAFLLKDEARYITGQVIHACGGTSVNFIRT